MGAAVPDQQPTQREIKSRKNALLGLFDRMLPVLDGIADSFRFATLLGLVLVVWVFVWMFQFSGFGVVAALLTTVLISLPILVLLRFWLGLDSLKNLPQTVEELAEDARDEVKNRVEGIRSAEQKMGLLGSAGKLWELRSLVAEAQGLLGTYVNIGTLLNPVSLVLGFLSLLYIPGLALVGGVLLVMTLI
jgi:hypothetical protein